MTFEEHQASIISDLQKKAMEKGWEIQALTDINTKQDSIIDLQRKENAELRMALEALKHEFHNATLWRHLREWWRATF